jgi:hypothetical protein
MIIIAEYFADGGRIKTGSALYCHLSKKDISLGEGLSYLNNQKGEYLDIIAEYLNVSTDLIIEFIRYEIRWRHYLNKMKEYEQGLN